MSYERISSIGQHRLAHDTSKILTVGLPMSYGSQSGSLCELDATRGFGFPPLCFYDNRAHCLTLNHIRDDPAQRTLTSAGFTDSTGMTASFCVNLCMIEKIFTPVSRTAKTVVSFRLDVAFRASSSFVTLRYFNHTFWMPDCGNITSVGATSASPEDCSSKCVGNASEICGGSDRLNLYWSGAPPPPQPTIVPNVGRWDYVGCFG